MPSAVNVPLLRLVAAMTLGAGVAGCSHVDPYAQVAHSKEAAASAAADARALFPPFTAQVETPEAEAFTGWMPYAFGRVDRTRLGLLNAVASIGRQRDFYEGSLLALTPPLLYGLSRSADHPDSRTATLAVGSGLAVWGVALSRLPAGAENTLATGAHRLTCLMAESSEFLYTRDELPLLRGQRKSELLRLAILDYTRVTDEVVNQLAAAKPAKVNEASCSSPGSDYCRARRQQRNTGGGDPTTGLDATRETVRLNLRLARDRLEDLVRLESQVEFTAPMALLQRSQSVMSDVDTDLRNNRPELLQLRDAMAQITDATRTLRAAAATAQGSGSSQTGAPTLVQPLPFPSAQRSWGRSELDAEQRIALRERLDRSQSRLASSVLATDGLKRLQQDKKEAARRLTDDLQCRSATPTLLVKPGTAASEASAPVPSINPLPVRP